MSGNNGTRKGMPPVGTYRGKVLGQLETKTKNGIGKVSGKAYEMEIGTVKVWLQSSEPGAIMVSGAFIVPVSGESLEFFRMLNPGDHFVAVVRKQRGFERFVALLSDNQMQNYLEMKISEPIEEDTDRMVPEEDDEVAAKSQH